MAQQHVIDLAVARARRADPATAARRRFAGHRTATGLPSGEFATALTGLLGWRVTAAQVTAWESSAVPPGDVLAAAEMLTPTGTSPLAETMRLVHGYSDVQAALRDLIDGAEQHLAITGSRSRDPVYLERIERALTARPGLIHWRVMYGPARHSSLPAHLLRLIDLHRPTGTLHIGILEDMLRDGERFIVASEHGAVVVLPSLSSPLNYDTAVSFDDPEIGHAYVEHVRAAWLASTPLADRAAIEQLEVR